MNIQVNEMKVIEQSFEKWRRLMLRWKKVSVIGEPSRLLPIRKFRKVKMISNNKFQL